MRRMLHRSGDNEAMGRRQVAESHGRLERELTAERAAALRRICETLESLIEQLNALQARIGQPHWADDRPELAQYRALRRTAVQYRWYLEVQREALGLHPTHGLDEFYRIPSPL